KYQDGVRNKGNLFPSIDIRGDGGYIVVSPSVHVNGDYQWEVSNRPSEVDIAEAPGWLLESVKTKHNGVYKAKPVTDYIRILQGVGEGERNNALITLIGHLLARNIDYRE